MLPAFSTWFIKSANLNGAGIDTLLLGHFGIHHTIAKLPFPIRISSLLTTFIALFFTDFKIWCILTCFFENRERAVDLLCSFHQNQIMIQFLLLLLTMMLLTLGHIS